MLLGKKKKHTVAILSKEVEIMEARYLFVLVLLVWLI